MAYLDTQAITVGRDLRGTDGGQANNTKRPANIDDARRPLIGAISSGYYFTPAGFLAAGVGGAGDAGLAAGVAAGAPEGFFLS